VPRIRSIKPSFWSDEAIAELSIPARLLVVGLISSADDEGRFLASNAAIAGYVFPHDDHPPTKIRRWLDEIETQGVIRLYSVNRREYGAFPKWTSHQKINRPTPSILPAPPTLRAVI
jgi:hypothetical protein